MAEPVVTVALGSTAKVAPDSRVRSRVKPVKFTLPPKERVAPDLTVMTLGVVVPARTWVEPRMANVPWATVRLPSVTVGPLMPMVFVPVLVRVKPAKSRLRPKPFRSQRCVPPMEALPDKVTACRALVWAKFELLTIAPRLPTPVPAMVTVRPERLMLLATAEPERSKVAPAAIATAVPAAPSAASLLMRSVPPSTRVAPV